MADKDSSQKDTYFVAVKLFLERNGKLLVMRDKFDAWDLPGGRIKKHEFETPLVAVIKRKMSEELGDDIQYVLDERPEVLMRHERTEASTGEPARIFAIGYRAMLKSGEPRLSEAHTEMRWVNIATFKPEQSFQGGWLKGVQDYLAMRRNESSAPSPTST